MKRTKLFHIIAEYGLLPGDLAPIHDISYSTLLRWENRGWIRDVTAQPRRGRFAFTVVTTKGYKEA